MAYIDTKDVKKIRDTIKATYPNYKWSITRRHYSSVVVALMESDLTFKENYIQVNHYYIDENYEDNPRARDVLLTVVKIINDIKLNYDRNAGDPYADYGDSNYFINVHVGKWDQPHKTVLPVSEFIKCSEVPA